MKSSKIREEMENGKREKREERNESEKLVNEMREEQKVLV